MHYALGIVLTALMGISLGLLGGGGSILAVPILVYVLGVEPHAAIAFSLVLVGSTALIGALFHHREGQVGWRDALVFALCASPLSLVGARLSMQLRGPLLLLLFGVLMLVTGGVMLRPRRDPMETGARNWAALVASAAGVGFLTGFLGVGGGFLIVPALVIFVRLPMKRAVGTSLFVIACTAAVAAFGHRAALEMQWGLLGMLAAAALAGTVCGVLLSRRFSAPQLRRVFGVFVIVLGMWMVGQNAYALLAP